MLLRVPWNVATGVSRSEIPVCGVPRLPCLLCRPGTGVCAHNTEKSAPARRHFPINSQAQPRRRKLQGPRSCYNHTSMAKRVSLFVTCIVDQLFPKVGMAMADVLERAGCEV